jgi:protocatechuate 3,4-dioxygenase beta subunit
MKKPATKASSSTRRGLLKALSAFAGSSLIGGGKALAQTVSPRAAEGPFYPTISMRMDDVDKDLVRVIGLVREAGGEVITLRGRITDRYGNPRAGHRIEIWQCDLNGKYLHPGDDRNVLYDQGFQGFGHDITDADGNYSFRTIKPGRYPGSTPHIHVKVFEEGRELLTTQFYVAGEPENQQDSLFRRMSSEEAESVSMRYVETADGTETTINLAI